MHYLSMSISNFLEIWIPLKVLKYNILGYVKIRQDIVHTCIWLCVCVLSRFSHVWFFATLWTIPRQGPLSMGFSRQEHWSGLPFPSLGDLPFPGIKSSTFTSPALAGKLTPIFSGAAVREGIPAPDCQPEISFSMNTISCKCMACILPTDESNLKHTNKNIFSRPSTRHLWQEQSSLLSIQISTSTYVGNKFWSLFWISWYF